MISGSGKRCLKFRQNNRGPNLKSTIYKISCNVVAEAFAPRIVSQNFPRSIPLPHTFHNIVSGVASSGGLSLFPIENFYFKYKITSDPEYAAKMEYVFKPSSLLLPHPICI